MSTQAKTLPPRYDAVTNREDWAISGLAQKGISSTAYVPGPYSPREDLPSAFDHWILEHERRNHG
jgi:Ring hydroxylating alpha subunit (catalytic domain)